MRTGRKTALRIGPGAAIGSERGVNEVFASEQTELPLLLLHDAPVGSLAFGF